MYRPRMQEQGQERKQGDCAEVKGQRWAGCGLGGSWQRDESEISSTDLLESEHAVWS